MNMSITKRRLDYFLKDEKMATNEYKKAAEKVPCDKMEKMFKEMSHDENKHAGYLRKMEKMMKEWKNDES